MSEDRPADASGGAVVPRLLELCTELERTAGVPTSVTDAVREALAEPLRLAVVGRVKAGKSTVVNALVGRQVAPVRAGECTQVVTWYRWGSPDRAELVMRDGTRTPLRFVDGRLPEDLDVPLADVERIDVQLQSRALEHLVLLDTPGLATTTTDLEAATRRALLGGDDSGADGSSRRAAAQADALLFLFRDTERADEVDFLDEFRSATGELGGSAVNVVGLLSHADLYGDGLSQDPVFLASVRAQELAASRAEQVATVLPVSGLMAETARTGRLRQDHVRLLAQLADADPDDLTLWSMGVGGPPEGLDELVGLIGPWGLKGAREAAASGRVSQVLAWLEETSGLAALEELVVTRLVRRSVPIKADHALTVLEAAAAALPDPDDALDAVDRTRLDPALHSVREVRALAGLLRSSPNHPLVRRLSSLVDADDDAVRVGLPAGSDAPDVARTARELADAAQATSALAATSDAADAARVASRSYALVARRAEAVRAQVQS